MLKHFYCFQSIGKYVTLIITTVLLTACASGLERPLRDIEIRFHSFEYLSSSQKGMVFAFMGKVHNPNEFSIRPLRFTYQVSLDGRHFENGIIDIQGIDSRLGLQLGAGAPELTENDAKLFYKSNSPFRFLLEIPFSNLGGLSRAMERKILPYTINLILTEERGKRAVMSKEGNINLSAILQPLQFRNLIIEKQDKDTLVSFELNNANDFDVTMESCSYQLRTSAGSLHKKIGEPIQLKANSRQFFRVREKTVFTAGTPFTLEAGCSLKDSWFGESISGQVQ